MVQEASLSPNYLYIWCPVDARVIVIQHQYSHCHSVPSQTSLAPLHRPKEGGWFGD